MKPLSTICLSAILFASLGAPLSAQEKAAAVDIDARRESVVVLKSHIAQRQARLDALATEINALDGRVETSVAEIVKMVSGIRDSEESQVRVARLKADIVVGLRKSVEIYTRHRDSLREQLRSDVTPVPRATLQSDLDRFIERIELRIEQVKTIAESFSDPKDLPKYVKTGKTTTWGNWTFEEEKISEAWRQDRKEGRHTTAAQEQLVAALMDSIKHLSERNSLLEEKLKNSNITAAERELYTADLGRNATLIENREAQIHSVQSRSDNAASLDDIKPLDRNAAHETELFVHDMRDDLRSDFFGIFRKYAELNKARAELHTLNQNLAAREKWLQDYDAKQAK